MKVRIGGNGTAPGSSLWLWCPGCDDAHRITIDTPGGWTWDGNEATPTINPSILVHPHKKFAADNGHNGPGRVVDAPRCHSFVRAGQWQFLADCTHELAGQMVPMVPLPDWLSAEYVS